MRTTLDLDRRLLDETAKISGEKTLSLAVNRALGEFIRQERKRRLLASLGNRDLNLDDWSRYRHEERT